MSFLAFPGFDGDITLAYVPVNGLLGGAVRGHRDTGSSHVEAFGANGAVLRSFFAYPGFDGGVQLGVGNTTGSGQSELLTLAVGTDHEMVFSTGGSAIDSFLAAPGPGVDLADSLLWFARQRQL